MALQQDLSQLIAFQRMSMPLLNMGLLVLARTLAFIYFAPLLNRKDIPTVIKINLGLFLTLVMVYQLPVMQIAVDASFTLLVFMNIMVGAVLGILLDWVLQAVIGAGSILNNQIGLSAANVFDPARRTQTALLEGLFIFIVGAVFIHMQGFHWLIGFLQKTFVLFPINQFAPNIFQYVSLEYVIMLSGDTIKVGVEVMAAAFIGTLFLDVVLGVVNKSAQQIPVFQLSNSVKPLVGITIFLLVLPLFIDSVQAHLIKHLKAF
jgi:flagellar biosynthesis protein FliR